MSSTTTTTLSFIGGIILGAMLLSGSVPSDGDIVIKGGEVTHNVENNAGKTKVVSFHDPITILAQDPDGNYTVISSDKFVIRMKNGKVETLRLKPLH